MWSKAEGLSWEEYFVRSYSSIAITQAIMNVLYDEDIADDCFIEFSTGDLLFEVEDI